MRILFFNYEYPPLGAGAANATAYLMEEFSKTPELEIDLVTSSVSNNYALEKIGERILVHRLPIGKNETNLHYQTRKELIIYSLKAWFFARKLIKSHEKAGKAFGLSHSFFTVPCGFISLLLKIEFGLPYIISLRGSDVPGYSDRFAWMYKFITPIIKLVWKNSVFVISNSEGLRELAKKSGTKKEIGLIYNGVDINHFNYDSGKRDGNKFIITTGASRITHRKGLEYLIRATADLKNKYPELLVKIMGEGNAQEDLEKLVKNLKLEKNVEFLGRIPREKTVPYYQEASLFVLPSLNEGMSNAMLEALSCGLPLISTRTGGADELVKEKCNGFFIETKDSQDLAQKIEKLISNNALRESMGRASRELAEEMSWQKVARSISNFIKKLQFHKS